MLIMGFHQLSCLQGNLFLVNTPNNEANELVMIKLGSGSRVKNQLTVRWNIINRLLFEGLASLLRGKIHDWLHVLHFLHNKIITGTLFSKVSDSRKDFWMRVGNPDSKGRAFVTRKASKMLMFWMLSLSNFRNLGRFLVWCIGKNWHFFHVFNLKSFY